MQLRPMIASIALACMAFSVGCTSEEQLQKVEQEVGDLKLEVFKLRQQVEDANRLAEAERKAAGEARVLDRRFQADLQEVLRQLQESTRILNNRIGSAASTRAAKPGTPEAPQPAAASDDEKAFNAAVLDYNRGNYALAAESLTLFLKSHADSPRRPDALFFLGLSYYNQKSYDKASPVFDQIMKDHASSNQFLPAKLKRAQCFVKQGLKPAAVKAFNEITSGFPGTPEARTAQQELADLGF
ncbi:MAG TPA: tetratricopeptide repeat protein [Holophaga sp.]|nr:tetratricopeptide repeat protein [Holophaga sp.]HPS67771.1 tetratricopeptide repeat protein [Holophaga sp.]